MEKINTNQIPTLPGYHITVIKKGVLGESSKILEEVEELIDAEKQESKLMALIELADVIGAVESYLEKKKYGMTIDDLIKMSHITKRAFVNGHRT
jgi:phosphoribosyl-ATP pyrophosphohydrolase